MITNRGVLLLNFSYEPIGIIDVQRAICLQFKNRVYIEEIEDGLFIHSPNEQWETPSVVRLREYVNIRKKRRNTAKKRSKIFIRDKFKCVYCLGKFNQNKLTLDHIIPKAQNGKDEASNLVTCCIKCNQYKDDRTPQQAGMKLHKKESELKVDLNQFLNPYYAQKKPKWKRYLYLDDSSLGDEKYSHKGD